MSRGRRNFHTFDGLRFFAFLLVFMCHVAVGNNPMLSLLSNGGSLGVTFFFCSERLSDNLYSIVRKVYFRTD